MIKFDDVELQRWMDHAGIRMTVDTARRHKVELRVNSLEHRIYASSVDLAYAYRDSPIQPVWIDGNSYKMPTPPVVLPEPVPEDPDNLMKGVVVAISYTLGILGMVGSAMVGGYFYTAGFAILLAGLTYVLVKDRR